MSLKTFLAKGGRSLLHYFLVLFRFHLISLLIHKYTSTAGGGNWSATTTWVGGVVPGPTDDVTIVGGSTVTVDAAAACKSITISGTLSFSAGINLDVNGNWTNNGTFNASTGSVTFKGATSNTINGSSPTSFNNIIVNKGTDITSVLEANGAGAITNTGNITITNGLFKMTTGTFQFNAAPTIPATGGLWISGATLNGGNFSTTTNGLLRITSGTANFGTNSGNALEVNNNGAGTPYAFLDMQGGTMNVSGRLFINNHGTIMMSNGLINICTAGLSNSSFASFEVTATSHINTINGGTIVFQNVNSGTGGDLLITAGAGTKSITGGTFQFGNASTPAAQTFRVDSDIPVYNLLINSFNSPVVRLEVSDLTINNQLTLNGGNLDAATNVRTVIVTNSAVGSISRTNGHVTE